MHLNDRFPSLRPARTRAPRRALIVFACFAVLTGIALAPLTLHPGTWVAGAIEQPGHWDYFQFHWNLWWLRHAVLTGQDPYTTDMVLAPYTHNLAYHTLAAAWLPVYLALVPLAGAVAAVNLITALALALTGALMAAFLRRQGVSRGGALIGGAALAFAPYMLDHAASSHLNLIAVFWLPLALLLWERVAITRRAAWALLLGLALWGMWLTDPLVLLWVAALLGPYALLTLVRQRAAWGRIVALGVLALAVMLALGYVLAPLRQMLAYDTEELIPADDYTLRAYSLPLEALFFQPGDRDRSLGLLLNALVLAGLFVPGGDRRRWFWLLAALPALILALGPDVRVGGVRVPLPFRLVFELTEGQLRTPVRFLPAATVALVTFAALTFDPWLRRVRPAALRGVVAGLLVAAFLLDYGALAPFPSAPAPPAYDFYAMMRAERYPDYDYVVLDVPVGVFSGWREAGSHARAQFYAVTHEKRTVSGMLARFSPTQHLYYDTSPLFAGLTGLQVLGTGPDIAELARIVDEWPVGYVVVHLNWLSAERALNALAFMNAHPSLCFVTVERDAVLYRTTSHPKGCPPRLPPETDPGTYVIDLGAPGDEGFIGHGWYAHEDIGGVRARWAGDRLEALLYAHLPPDAGEYRMTVRVAAFAAPREVDVVANGVPLGAFTVPPDDWSEHTVTIPADVIAGVGGDLILSLSADGAASAAELGLSSDPRPLTLAYDWVRFSPAG